MIEFHDWSQDSLRCVTVRDGIIYHHKISGDFPIRFFSIVLTLLLLPFQAVSAATISVNLSELDEAIIAARDEPDAIQRLVLSKIQQRLQQADLQFVAGEVLYQDTVVDQLVEGGCTSTRIQQLQTDISLAGDTAIEFSFESLFDPLRFSLDLNANINSVGRARQVFGIRLGNCIAVASDSFDFTANGPLRLSLALSVDLSPVWVTEDTLRVRPTINIDGELREGQINVSVDDTVLRSFLEDFIQGEVDELLGADRIRDEIAELQLRIDRQLQESLSDDASSPDSEGFIDIKLPASDDEQILALYELLTPQARFPLTESYLQSHRLELLAALILNDNEALTEITSNAAECELGAVLQTSLQPEPVYRKNAESCALISRPVADGNFFSDSNCQQSFDFVETTLADFCQVALDPLRLGNPMSRSGELNRWSLSPGSRFDLGALSIQGKQQPYVQRQNYKTVYTPAGECQLEMRVYAGQPDPANGKALIALHGGSWQRRGTGFLGIENMATHFVDKGFVVFAPFYRLVGENDGTSECRNASLDDILEDINDALDWVTNKAVEYGVSGKPVVFGQSAGGHLALSLAVRRAQEIERAILFYAPTDFGDFINQVQTGEYSGEQGQRILAAVTSSDSLQALDANNPLVRDNSYPSIIAAQPNNYPPVFMLHGESDTLLPFRQSVRLCNGLSGDVDSGPAGFDVNTSSVSRSVRCDERGSVLHLISEGEHTLDLCISDDLCLAGSPASASATADSIDAMLDWATADSLLSLTSENRATGGSGSTGLPGLGILVLLGGFVRFARVLRGR